MKKHLALALVAVMLLTLFAGCSKKAVDHNNNVVNGEFTEYLIAEKVGTLDIDNFMTADGGIYYKGDNGLYGVMSYNGARDTGAIYTSVVPLGKYFIVRTTEITGTGDFNGLNSGALIDGKGKTIIPAGFASFEKLSDRYIKVTKVTERSYDKDETIACLTENGLCFDGSFDDHAWYKGNWFVFDTEGGALVPGATGSTYELVTAKGRYVQFDNADGNAVKINEKGEPLPDGARLFENGTYYIEGRTGEVYSATGDLMFSYDLAGFTPYASIDDGYIASKYADGTSKYVIMDTKGNVISSEFASYPTVYGGIVQCDDKIYNLKGETVLEGTYESVYFDKVFGQNWMLRNDDYYTLIDKNGAVFFNGPDDDEHTVWTGDFLASKEIDGSNYYYSHKDQDYTIKGYAFAPWIVETTSSNSLYDLVDTMTGKKLLEGYSNYDSISRDSLAYYVYAVYNGGADVYLVVSGAQLADVLTKKNSLFDDLIAAFAAEGITVSVDKVTGEIALDSSVLFGGDSAELTADGKAFLNKFIKAYTTVAFSGKYEDFISKTMVEGHTAPLADSTYASGLPLSQERAANVKNYCLSADTGVDVSMIADSLEDVGYSNSKPIYNADGSVNLAACRRVSFRFIVNVEF